MTVLENMQAVLPSLPKNERKAAEYLLNYPHDIQRRSAEIIAQDAGISRSAIVRLCQKLGYQGWSEFKYAYLHEPALAASAQEHNILTRYENIIQKLRQGVSADQIQTIVQIIHRANRVITLGNYHSGMSAQQMAYRQNRSGTLDRVVLQPPAEDIDPVRLLDIGMYAQEKDHQGRRLDAAGSGARASSDEHQDDGQQLASIG